MKNKKQLSVIIILSVLLFLQAFKTSACSRVMYSGKNDIVITARSMDWVEDIKSNLWLFPRGIERSGAAGQNSLKWKAKYGSVVTSAYEIASTDGMNEKGLVVNALWLDESEYPKNDGVKPAISISIWVQYVLDNFANVNEAVDELLKEKFVIVTLETPTTGGRAIGLATLHLALSDPSGDNAILEYINGKLIIHHGKEFQVMTNSPTFDKQLAIDEYWKAKDGNVMLPGTINASDRFVRASYYVKAVNLTDNIKECIASMFGIIRNISVPYGICPTPGKPNLSSTVWRSLADQKNKVYYFESTISPNIFWVELKDADFSESAPIKKLSIINGETYAGNTVKDFKVSQPFKFLGI